MALSLAEEEEEIGGERLRASGRDREKEREKEREREREREAIWVSVFFFPSHNEFSSEN